MTLETTRQCLLVVDDSADTRELLQRNLTSKGYEVLCAATVEEALRMLEFTRVDVVITDLKMPGASGLELVRHVRENFPQTEVMMITGYPSIDGAVAAVKSGAEEYLTKPFTKDELFAAVKRVIEKLNLRAGNRAPAANQSSNPIGIIGESEAMQKVIKAVYRAASVSEPILITGEHGAGKDLLANAIHRLSPRSGAPFITVDCASWPDNLHMKQLSGELSEKRPQEPALWRVADSGTIYFKEIEALSLENQEILSAILEKRLSAKADVADWALVAGASRDIPALVGGGKFNEALFSILKTESIAVPPLRERGNDVLLLARHFLEKYSTAGQRKASGFSERALEALKGHTWPGNVGELQNVIAQIVRTVESSIIDVADLPPHMRYSIAAAGGPNRSLAQVEAMHIRNVMADVGGNKSRAAEILGINRKTLREKLKQAHLPESQLGGERRALPDE